MPCFFEHARKSDPTKGHAVTPYIYLKPTNNKFIPTRDIFTIKYYMNGHSWHLCFIDFSIQMCIRDWRWILPLYSKRVVI